MHLLVDAICACCIVLLTPGEVSAEVVWLCVTYNVLAFMTQPLTGWAVDSGHIRGALWIAVALLMCAGGMNDWGMKDEGMIDEGMKDWGMNDWGIIVLLGLGNSLFHVWGGRSVARRSGNDMRHLGVFVSTGALGLMLGSRCASTGLLWGLLAMLVLTAVAYAWMERRCVPLAEETERGPRTVSTSGGVSWGLMGLLMLLVMLRSLYGQLVPTEARGLGDYALLATVLAFVAKAGGGWLGLRWGTWRSLTVALLTAGTAMLGGALGGTMGAAAMLLMVVAINVTMPMTLHLMNGLLRGREGLSFGLLAAALMPGVGLSLLPIDWPMLYALTATMVIEALVLLALRERRWQVLGASVAMNIVTNLCLNALILYGMDHYPTWPLLSALELLVCAVEAVGYYAVMRDWKRATVYAVCCNGASCLVSCCAMLVVRL